jgi:hypothetical protein
MRQTMVSPALLTALRREVNVLVNDVPLSELVQRLGQGAEVGVTVSPRVDVDTMRVTADLRGLPLYAALAKLAGAARLTIAPSGGAILLHPPSDPAPTSAVTIWSAEWGSAPQQGFEPTAGGSKPRQ